jgi:ATP-dependent DNA helicase RecG
VIFEYRTSDAAGPAADRKEYRLGFFSFYDELWRAINLRNDRQHYQEGLFIWDILSFDERSVREAVLNAISHRDYQLGGSIFVRQYPRKLVIESPGGFPPGITTENILDRQAPRNRRIAEAFSRCGLVERSGQGMNLIFEQSIRQGKQRPDFTGTDAYQVALTLHGQVQNPAFIRFLERIEQETQAGFDVHDLLLLDQVHREGIIPAELRPRLHRLVDLGVIETVGRGRGTRYLLARRFYQMIGAAGTYTRRKGLDRETNKTLLLKHIRENAEHGVTLKELRQVLPSLSAASVQSLVRQLKAEGRVRLEGKTKAGRWYPAEAAEKPKRNP